MKATVVSGKALVAQLANESPDAAGRGLQPDESCGPAPKRAAKGANAGWRPCANCKTLFYSPDKTRIRRCKPCKSRAQSVNSAEYSLHL